MLPMGRRLPLLKKFFLFYFILFIFLLLIAFHLQFTKIQILPSFLLTILSSEVLTILIMVYAKKIINLGLVTRLRSIDMNWKEIAAHPDINVSRDCLLKWRKEVNFAEPKTIISNEQLDEVVQSHVLGQPRRGEVTVAAHISHSGYKVPRMQLRECIRRVDPEGVEERSRKKIKRAVYHSDGPHHVWHIDGNHKLIKWGIVIHGGIDGCSRSIIFLQASDNNLSTTVFDAFMGGVSRFQLPKRVRGDGGGENVLVAAHMIQNRGTNCGAFIAGSSKHNTRIERLWRDLRQHTIQAYIDLFRNFEASGMCLNNILDIYTLQYMFLPRINADLQSFSTMWNNHKISTEFNRTPLQLLEYFYADSVAEPLLARDVDGDGVVEEPIVHSVECNSIECPLSADQLLEFHERVHPLTLEDTFDTLGTFYRQGVNIISDIFHRV